MSKIADVYFETAPWSVTEKGFDPEYGQLAESIFSLGSEYMGIRGCFDEGYSGDSLTGSYFNGVYERRPVLGAHYKGIVETTDFMVNAVNWLYTRLTVKGETLDLHHSRFSGFTRTLDLKNGVLTRSFVWETASGAKLRLCFERIISMSTPDVAAQRITIEPITGDCKLELELGLDFSVEHHTLKRCLWECSDCVTQDDKMSILGITKTTHQRVYSGCTVAIDGKAGSDKDASSTKLAARAYMLKLKKNKAVCVTRLVTNVVEKNPDVPASELTARFAQAMEGLKGVQYAELVESNRKWWDKAWSRTDITISGDDGNQQGIRYCIFQMLQTFHGAGSGNNIGAKGLTGEAYNGNSFWDTEVYCLPFFIFTNPEAARSLLEFRYLTLPEAKARATALDCKGAFYPIATISGKECCDLWQHASLQLQASTAVVYGVWMYEKLTGDHEFVRTLGLAMLVEVCRMLATRGAWTENGERYGFYGVMGPDEFQMMVNHNCYTNYMARFSFDYALAALKDCREAGQEAYDALRAELGLTAEETAEWQRMSEKMYISYDESTGLYEQHSGYFDLPHVDVHSIPIEEFPLYSHWTYDRIYRNDMIKQPDVLMFMLMFNSQFTLEQIKANYEFYEPRCIHESSLSPSVHSILASQLQKHKEAYDFFGFATRLDLDNYNRNSGEGLHTTSIAGAWMNIIYGFGGMRSDGDMLSFSPSIPSAWNGYSFRIAYSGDVIVVDVDKERVRIRTKNGGAIKICLYGTQCVLGAEELVADVPMEYRG